jgi:hypothetical protein
VDLEVTSGKLRFLAALILLVMGGVALAAQSNKRSDKPLYKWVDEKGVVHYGDSVPPQYAKEERRVLNSQGVEVGKLEREKSDAERAADAARNRASDSARQRDQVLLTSYVSVDQIEEVRDQRLDLIEGQVRVTTQYLDTLQGRLKNLQTKAHFFRPYSSNETAEPMPDQLAEDLVRTVKEIRQQERNLAGKRAEQVAVREQSQSDIDRYLELRAPRAN